MVLWRRGHRLFAALPIVCAAAALFFTAGIENRWTAPPASAPARTFRLVHWNVFWGKWGWASICGTLRRDRPDVLVLNESPSDLTAEELARVMGPGFAAAKEGSISIAVRGDIVSIRGMLQTPGMSVVEADCLVESRPIRIHAVDIAAPPANARDPTLRSLLVLALERRADLVVGDFNSPRRSSALAPPPSPYRHAYDAAGRGWSYTFPVPFPVLAIDQCLFGDRIRPASYRLPFSIHSDHSRQVFDFGI